MHRPAAVTTATTYLTIPTRTKSHEEELSDLAGVRLVKSLNLSVSLADISCDVKMPTRLDPLKIGR